METIQDIKKQAEQDLEQIKELTTKYYKVLNGSLECDNESLNKKFGSL